MTNRRVHRLADRDAVARAVAARLVAAVAGLQEEQDLAQVCLCGGTTASLVYDELARLLPGSGVDPARLGLWWTDEAYAPTGEGVRHAGALLSRLAGSVALDPALIHAMPARLDSVDVDDAALRYATELGDVRFDLCLLSLGPHGEVAAIFDGIAAARASVAATHHYPADPPERITITIPTINRSREVWVMASGEQRACVVAAALTPGSALPAARVEGTRVTRWFVDGPAAADLPRYDCGW